LTLGPSISYTDLYPEAALDDEALVRIARDHLFQTRLQAVTILPAYFIGAVKFGQGQFSMARVALQVGTSFQAASPAPLGASEY